jgi:exodeoxyribonuclease-3
MPKIISANLNGIRSAATKGFFTWMAEQDADFVCVQELKAQAPDMQPEFLNPGLPRPFPLCREKGYSGTGVYSKVAPDRVVIGFGAPEFDAEGRYVRCDFGNLTVISVYCPSGSPARNARKPNSASWTCSCRTCRRCTPKAAKW